MNERFDPPRRAGAVEVMVSQSALADIAAKIEQGQWADLTRHLLALEAVELSTRPHANKLLIEEHCRDLWQRVGLIPFPYQLQTCRRSSRKCKAEPCSRMRSAWARQSKRA